MDVVSVKIISGKNRGMSISVPSSARPTLAKSRQSLFDMLVSINLEGIEFGKFFDDKVVLDCFAGSGALGIEALSRGAKFAYFVDKSKEAAAVLHSNIRKLKLEDRADVICLDIFAIRGSSAQNSRFSMKSNLVFFDPPYEADISVSKLIQSLSNCGVLADNLIFAAETNESLDDLEIKNYQSSVIKDRKIGSSFFTIIKMIALNHRSEYFISKNSLCCL